ncbi:MAG: PEP-CTERM sorting domain-containing protein [Burkholderiales bacterium]|nr:PEP-CTERM sorting domain-containing protein [Burkholderiales bacterium]
MNIICAKSKVSGLMAAFAMFASASALALPITLPTSLLDANSTFTFSSAAVKALSIADLSVQALGNSRQLSGGGLAFELPVTSVTMSVGLLPPSITPVSGNAIGSALGIYGVDGGLVLSNFGLDFKNNLLTADLTTSTGTLKSFSVYSFNVAQGLDVALNGMSLSMTMQLTNLRLTSGALTSFQDALHLPDFMSAAMKTIDFGTVGVNITPSLRDRYISSNSFIASVTAVPEPGSKTLMFLGLVGLAAVARRKMDR